MGGSAAGYAAHFSADASLDAQGGLGAAMKKSKAPCGSRRVTYGARCWKIAVEGGKNEEAATAAHPEICSGAQDAAQFGAAPFSEEFGGRNLPEQMVGPLKPERAAESKTIGRVVVTTDGAHIVVPGFLRR